MRITLFSNMNDLFSDITKSFSFHSDLVFNLICLVFADIPIQLEKFIQIGADLSRSYLFKASEVLYCQIFLLKRVQKSSILNLKVSNQFNNIFFFNNPENIAKFSPDDGKKWWIVGIFYAFINHIYFISVVEDMSDEHKISTSVQSIVRFVYLIHKR